MNRALVSALLAVWMCQPAQTAIAQSGGASQRGSGAGTRMYDPKTVETVTGTVIKLEQLSSKGRGNATGVHLLLKTSDGDMDVHLGPKWFLDKQSVKIAPQDTVEVRGSRVTSAGKPAIIAAEVKKGDLVLNLRDENGIPLWRGQGRRSGGRGSNSGRLARDSLARLFV